MTEKRFLKFEIEGELFAVFTEEVVEIINYCTPNKLLNTAHFIDGVINHRGKIVPVVNLKKLFQFCITEPFGKIILISKNDSLFALPADRVIGIDLIDESDINKDLSWRVFLSRDEVLGCILEGTTVICLLNTDFLCNCLVTLLHKDNIKQNKVEEVQDELQMQIL